MNLSDILSLAKNIYRRLEKRCIYLRLITDRSILLVYMTAKCATYIKHVRYICDLIWPVKQYLSTAYV